MVRKLVATIFLGVHTCYVNEEIIKPTCMYVYTYGLKLFLKMYTNSLISFSKSQHTYVPGISWHMFHLNNNINLVGFTVIKTETYFYSLREGVLVQGSIYTTSTVDLRPRQIYFMKTFSTIQGCTLRGVPLLWFKVNV